MKYFVTRPDYSLNATELRTSCTQITIYDHFSCMHLYCAKHGFLEANDAKCVGSWASAPDPDGGAYSAPPYPLAAIVPLPSLKVHYGHPPHSIPVSAPEVTPPLN